MTLQLPDVPDIIDSTIYVPYIDIDAVRYDDKWPWPSEPDGQGPSLVRINSTAFGNDPINWWFSPGPPSPGFENSVSRPPYVTAGPDRSVDAGSNPPFSLALNGATFDDGLPGPLSIAWSLVTGPESVSFDDPSEPATTVWFSLPGVYTLRLTASDGANTSTDDLLVTVWDSSAPLLITSSGIVGNPALFQLRFPAAPGQSYTVEYAMAAGGPWLTLAQIPLVDQPQIVEITDPTPPNDNARFYRVVTPQQP